jgi:hypothetical protein
VRTDANRDARTDVAGDASRSLREAEAGITAMFLAGWLRTDGVLSQGELEGVYACYLTELLRTIRFGTGEPHGRAALAQFEALAEIQAIRVDAAGRYTLDGDALSNALPALCERLRSFALAADDGGPAAAWLQRYGSSIPSLLAERLTALDDLPVDIVPDYELAHGGSR